MKKIASAILVAALLAPAACLAGDASGWLNYRSEAGSYSIPYPDGYLVCAPENREAVRAMYGRGELNERTADLYATAGDALEGSDIVLFVAPDNAMNATVSFQAIQNTFSMEDLTEALCPRIVEAYGAAIEGYEAIEAGAEVFIGGDFYAMCSGRFVKDGEAVEMRTYLFSVNDMLYSYEYAIYSASEEEVERLIEGMLSEFWMY